MHLHRFVVALAPALLAGYALAALPDNTVLKNKAVDSADSRARALVVAQEQGGLNANEQQLLNQIEADSAKLKADEAAERAGQRHVNPQIRFIRASLIRLSEAAVELRDASPHYSGHREQALRSMAEAHNHLMQCYRIDSGEQP
jgi:hypothetical protein